MRLGIISDTHGLLRPEALTALRGVDHIVHAGDIGGLEIIRALEGIAPVTFVEGNNDSRDGADIVRVTVGAIRVLLTHILPRPRAPHGRVLISLRDEPANLVVFGHSHLPHNEVIGGTRWFNPASAGPRRFDYPVAIGIMDGHGPRHVALERRMNQLSRR